jgi:hypothetical protein
MRQWRKTWLAVRKEALWIEVFDAKGDFVVRMEVSPNPDYADLAFDCATKIARKVNGEVRIEGVGRFTLATFLCREGGK